MTDQMTFERVLRAHLPLSEADQELRDQDRLMDLGLDSLSTVALLVDLESELAISLPDELLTADTFDSVGSLRQAVFQVLGAADQPDGGAQRGAL
ncbi:phosphopantetheine-binding protein [Lentzea sp. BCCO 10_0856]|uniref:Phosphopantetheine-binding protein n=1 Tax=Lentzea miocenica TaxID=3095431 RepID=A0ABU4T6Q9_9PSEU|nr:phosphopantetheine-binding protein [Lentzea sp. BCCO 10_0856]MDX8033838.1 phosphopantetheine-binding protein [Lentzea sp. BCCO 10_0856]